MCLRPCFPVSPPCLCLPPPSSSCHCADCHRLEEEPRQANLAATATPHRSATRTSPGTNPPRTWGPRPRARHPEPRLRHGTWDRFAVSIPPRQRPEAASSLPRKAGGPGRRGRKQRRQRRRRRKERRRRASFGPTSQAQAGLSPSRRPSRPASRRFSRSIKTEPSLVRPSVHFRPNNPKPFFFF